VPFEREARLYGSNFGAVEVDWLLLRARVCMSGASVSQLESTFMDCSPAKRGLPETQEDKILPFV